MPITQLNKPGRLIAGLLFLLPILMILGHWCTGNAIWSYNPKVSFSPWRNYVSDYAYRSPCWPYFIACMYGFAAVLGSFSLRFYYWAGPRRWMAWPICLLLGYGGLKLVEVAIYPVKSPEVTVEELQKQLDKSARKKLFDDIYAWGATLAGKDVPRNVAATYVVEGFQSNARHLTGIQPAMGAIVAAMVLGWIQSPRKWFYRRHWIFPVIPLTLLLIAFPPFHIFDGLVGLGQRIGFVGVYVWMWQMLGVHFAKEVGVLKPALNLGDRESTLTRSDSR